MTREPATVLVQFRRKIPASREDEYLRRSCNQCASAEYCFSKDQVRVLYVEDNSQLRDAIAALLEADGRSITTCVSAEEALELDEQQPFDLVITDVTLPGMSGVELSARLLSSDPERRIVLCSGHMMDDKVKELGAPHVRALLKPFSVDDLETLVEDAQAELAKR